ncbi:MAG TPA: S8 family serine peptidase [Bacteroidota bacterium]|nr:S8 family serine peptidase [Bacteroidota bacterium]
MKSFLSSNYIPLALLLLLISNTSLLDAQKKWIFLQGGKSVSQTTAQELEISKRALERRAKTLPSDKLIDEYDIPVSQDAIRMIEQTGAKVNAVSRWLNAVSVTATNEQMASIQSLPIVSKVRAVAKSRREPPDMQMVESLKRSDAYLPEDSHYGDSRSQVASVNAIPLHQAGVTGKNAIIGMLDDGFNNHRTHAALKSIKVLGEYDFVQDDSSTSLAYGEYGKQGMHGAATLSVLGGYAEGKLIGVAYGASFYLAKTEIDSIEVQEDEDNFIEGLEWLERQGVDLVSTSLGYDDFDPSRQYDNGNGKYDEGDITYSMKDGKTAPTTQAVQVAVRKGLLVVVSAGNERWPKKDTIIQRDSDGNITGIYWGQKQGTGSITTPADADSILAVGATYSYGKLAAFSSTGPTADGRIKPDVVAQGSLICAVDGGSTAGYFSSWSGTSFAAPLVAGAAALILSAHPSATAMEIRDAILATAHAITDTMAGAGISPNNYYGYGSVDAYEAALLLGPIVSDSPTCTKIDSGYIVNVVILSKNKLVEDSLFYFYRFDASSPYRQSRLTRVVDSLYTCFVPSSSQGGFPDGYFFVIDTAGKSEQQPLEIDELIPQQFMLYQNYPNPFNSNTTILFDMPQECEGELVIFNILGQRVKTLYSGAIPAARNSKQWDGTDDHGQRVASGIYFYRLKTKSSVVTRKMLYLK